jgi:hypothetical protein
MARLHLRKIAPLLNSEEWGLLMQKLKIVPITTRTAEEIRKKMKSPVYGFPAHREIAAGRAPCRHCLKLIRPQVEELILFTYDAFYEQGVGPMPGPVYVHAADCSRYTGDGEIPAEYLGQPLTFEAFGADRTRIAERRVAGEKEDDTVQELFQQAEVQYVHVRSTSAGCYLFRIERAD